MKGPAVFLLFIAGLALLAIFWPESPDPEHRHYACQPLLTGSSASASAYILPYAAGAKYPVNQANCSGHGHSNFWNHGYDFVMEIGTPVSAARDGEVGWARDGCNDGDRNCTNLIRHDDGTVALYSHLTKGGVQVLPGQHVKAGQLIGRSGNTGNTGGLPHLHFSLHPCNELPGLPNAGACPTIPVNFRNTDANPNGLLPGRAYLAQ